MPIASKVKDLKSGLKAREYDETGSNPEKVTRTIVDNEGRKAGEFVKVGSKVVETSATPDVKTAGIKIDEDCLPTNPSLMADDVELNGTDEIEKAKMLKKTQDLAKAQLPQGHVYHATIKDKYGAVLHAGHYRNSGDVNKLRESWERYSGNPINVHLKVVPDPKMKKSAPVLPSGGASTLQKAKEEPPVKNIIQMKASGGYNPEPRGLNYGEVGRQTDKNKMLGVTQRLRSKMKGKLGVIQGDAGKAKPFNEIAKPGQDKKTKSI